MRIPRSLTLATLSLVCLPAAQAQLLFNFTDGATLAGLSGSNPTLYNNVRNGFQAGANRWSALLNDNVTINVTIDFPALAPGILGQASSASVVQSYGSVRTALVADALTADDAQASASLPAGASLTFVTSNTAGTRVLDNDGSGNNAFLDINRANAKALGLVAGNAAGEDAAISFSSNFTWDFDPSNGILGSAYDFIGVATHEIGHALGFTSGVDTVDYYSGPTTGAGTIDLNPYAIFNTLDLYRYSASADTLVSGTRVMDLAQGGSPFFSLDGGTTNLALFSTGPYDGDGRQASHWKDNLGLGILDPTAAPGELLAITALDRRALDVIGWNLSAASAPEPGTLSLLALGGVGVIGLRRRNKTA
jgi:PEP-CTERM motif